MNTRRLFARILSAALVLAGCFFVLTACGKESGKGTPTPAESVQDTPTETVTPSATMPAATSTPEPTAEPSPEPTPESQAEAFPDWIPLAREPKKTKEEFLALAKAQTEGILKTGYRETTAYAEPYTEFTYGGEEEFLCDKAETYYEIAPGEEDGDPKAKIYYLHGEKVYASYVTDYGTVFEYRGKMTISPSVIETDEKGRTIYIQSGDSYTYTEYDEEGTEYSAAYDTDSRIANLNITKFDEHGNRTARYTYRGSNGKAYPKSKTLFAYVYDDNGNIIRYTVTDYDWSWTKAKTEKEFTYDAVGNVLSGAQTEFGETGNKTVKTEYTYHKDEKGRVVSIQSKKTSSDSDTIEEKEQLMFYHDDGSVLWLWNVPVSEGTSGQWFYPSEKMAKEIERGAFPEWVTSDANVIRNGGMTHTREGKEEDCFSWLPDDTMWQLNTYSNGLLVHEVNMTKNGGDYYYEYNAKKQLVRVYGCAGVVGESEIKYTYDSKGNRTAIEKKGRAYVVVGPFTADEYYSDKIAVENIRYSYDNEGKKTTKEYKITVDGKTVGTSKQSFDKDGKTVRLEAHCFLKGKEIWKMTGERIN